MSKECVEQVEGAGASVPMTDISNIDVPEGTDELSRNTRRAWRDRLNSASTRKMITGVLATLVGGSFWGFSGTSASFLFDTYHVDTLWLMSVRQILAGLLFMAVVVTRDRERLIKLWTTPADRKQLLLFTAFGLLFNQFCYLSAVRLTNAGTATVLQCLQLVIIMGYTCAIDRRMPRTREVIGIGLALAVARMRRFQGLADAVITLPLVLPPTVVGFFLLLAFGRRSAIGKFLLQFDVTIVFTWKAAVMAAIVVSLPLMYRTARGAFEQIDPNILGAARTLGVSEWRIFWHILVPNARSGILAGLVLSFTRALGEFGATIMFAGNIPGVTQTMSTAVYAAVQANDYDLAFNWAIVIIVFSLVFVTLMNALIARTGAPQRREV